MNNEKDKKNDQYKKNLMSLTNYVMVMASDDSMVIPNVSEQHAFWKWGDDKTKLNFRDTDGYKGDWLGLQTMDTQKKVALLEYKGDHLRFSNEFWNQSILPYLAPESKIRQ